MKKNILMGVGLLASASLLVSCHDDLGGNITKGNGRIAPIVELNTETITSRSTDASSRAIQEEADKISAEDLTLRLTKSDGTTSWEWKLNDFPADKDFAVGTYTLEAYYGDTSIEGFECPSYYGSQNITVEDSKTTSPSLTATMSKAMVSISYTEAFQGYMADWSATVNSVTCESDNERPVYVTPGETNVKISVTKPNGLEATLTLDPIQTEARHHYTITVDVNNGNVGDAQLIIKFNDVLNEKEIIIDLSDKLLASPEPVIDAKGFQNDMPIDVVTGITNDLQLSMSLIAMAGIKEVNLHTTSLSLINQDWPEVIDLMTADAAMQKKLTSLGLSVVGLWKTPGEMAVIDFSNVVNHIQADNTSENRFEVSVKDKLLRESEPMALNLNVENPKLEISTTEHFNPGGNLNVTLKFNGATPESVKENIEFQYFNPLWASWENLKVVSVAAASRAMNSYQVVVATPDIEDDLQIRACCGTAESNVLTVTLAPFEVVVTENNTFSTYAYVQLVATGEEPVPSIEQASFEIRPADGVYAPINNEIVSGYAKISNLTPNTQYSIKAIVNGLSSKPTRFVTENGKDIPNGDFEELGEAFRGNIKQGGTWRTSALDFLSNYQNTADFVIQEANGWATTNPKTTNNWTLGNTWFNVPSVFNSTLTYTANCSGISGGAGKSSSTPDAYKNFTPHSGNNAMIIRNVAWDDNGTVPSVCSRSKSNASQYYNHTVPTIANNSVGKMFLGSYAYNGTETYNEGTNFSARPSALTGWYMYKPDNGDTSDHGVVVIEILNGNTVLASGYANLQATAEYTQFTINLDYNIGTQKATSIRVKVESSKYGSTEMASETANVKVTTYNSPYESYKIGATLVVDDFKFVY